MPQYEAVVAEFDVKRLLRYYGDADDVVDDIVNCVAKHTSDKWANSVLFNIKDIVRGIERNDPAYKVGLNFAFDNYIFLGYDPKKGVILRRRA